MEIQQHTPLSDGAPSYAHLSILQRANAWSDLVDAGLETVLEGMRRRTNSEEELRTVFGDWLKKRRADNRQASLKMMRVLGDHGADNGD